MNSRYFVYFFLAFIVNSIGIQKTSAQGEVPFEMSFFEDVNSTYSFKSIQKEVFVPSPEHLISLGITKSTIWVKIKVDTTLLDPESVLKIDRPFLDDITLSYQLKGNKEVRESLGIKYPHSSNQFNHFLPVFAIPAHQLASPFLYLKVQSRYSMLIPVAMSSQETFYKERVNMYLIGGLLIGGLLLMGLYNFFLFFSTRDSNYVIYVLSLCGAILSQGYIFGILIPYLSPDSPEFSFRFPVIIMAFTGICSLLFTMRFLEIKKASKIIYSILVSLVVFELISILLELLHLDYISRKVNILSVFIVSLALFSTAVFSLTKGNKRAFYFTIGWFIYLSGMIIFALKTAGIIPHNTFTAHLMNLGTFMEVILLSFALGNKFSLMRVEKNRLERQTLADLERLVDDQTKDYATSLNKKEVLLKEIHHRVKNNLQIVIGLLDLKASSVKDEKNKDVLAQSKARVYSMSLIHQKLYQSDNLARINVKNYLEELFSYIKNSCATQQGPVSYKLILENMELSITQAVPLGLIANELLANSFKHSLKPDAVTQINLSLTSTAASIIVKIAGSGNGFDNNTETTGVKKTLGLFLVKSLTKQLRAKSQLFFEKDLFITQLNTPIRYYEE